MGCISSKHVIVSPLPYHNHHHSSSLTLHNDNFPHSNHSYALLEEIVVEKEQDHARKQTNVGASDNDKESKKNGGFKFGLRFGRSSVAEHVAAGWPAWLSAVAGDAIHGWVPLKSDSFERLEKIGQGTYSNVYRARDLKTGRTMALKKVRFDNFQPESVRFMAREITILRRLDHPNIMKLEGIITSRLSCNIYLVFEYMEHDLAGLLSAPNTRFSDSQIKCYMQQLLKGIEHCHSRGILHRDIKTSNILVNSEGQLKIADFGLANFVANRQPLTSRVVTLWYRPPELFLGSTSYGTYVDMWSVGCVLAELFIGRPILKGRTEVEQLHKIFMLCGTPPEDYWTNPTLPLAKMSKPRHAYESSLKERCKELPKSAVTLIETLLSVEPEKRGSVTSALQSEFFHTRPYACDPASLPKYPPSKEIDAMLREEAHRRKAGGRLKVSSTSSRNHRRGRKALLEQTEARRSAYFHGPRGSADSSDTLSDMSQTTDVSHANTVCTLPALATTSDGTLGWSTKRRKQVSFVTPTSQDVRPIEPIQKQRTFDSSEVYKAQDLSSDHHEEERRRNSGPVLGQSHRTNIVRQGVPRSRFSRGTSILIMYRILHFCFVMQNYDAKWRHMKGDSLLYNCVWMIILMNEGRRRREMEMNKHALEK
ncbi:protein kinase-like domain-containing protein [Artemisia annua]|uniref:Protein kinase-like domain-containing protein n=1 Tax=Artemisia annua TaxID=35608 RepID=A0A2U1PAB6_ARTAN|nr:protein kinase-like domain-containing protein [Artemisia annua]